MRLRLGVKELAGAMEGREHGHRDKRQRGSNRRMYKENVSPKTFTWKMKGTEFCEFLQPLGLVSLEFYMSAGYIGIETIVHCSAPGKKAGRQHRSRLYGSTSLRTIWGTQCEVYSLFPECFLRGSFCGDANLGTKEQAGTISFHCPSTLTHGPPARRSSAPTLAA